MSGSSRSIVFLSLADFSPQRSEVVCVAVSVTAEVIPLVALITGLVVPGSVLIVPWSVAVVPVALIPGTVVVSRPEVGAVTCGDERKQSNMAAIVCIVNQNHPPAPL